MKNNIAKYKGLTNKKTTFQNILPMKSNITKNKELFNEIQHFKI
jgi:hypothetical protein